MKFDLGAGWWAIFFNRTRLASNLSARLFESSTWQPQGPLVGGLPRPRLGPQPSVEGCSSRGGSAEAAQQMEVAALKEAEEE